MKSKITLVILLVIIIFLGALSFFLGYKYLNEKDTVKALNSQVEILKNEQVINEQNSSNSENGSNQVVEVLSIPKFDSSKVDTSALGNVEITNIKEVECVEENPSDFIYVTGPQAYFQVRYKAKNYTISNTANIIDAKNNSVGSAGIWHKVFLLDDGTLKYTLVGADDPENKELEIKDYDLNNVVALVNVSYTTPRGTYTRLGAITSDGVTHILITE